MYILLRMPEERHLVGHRASYPSLPEKLEFQKQILIVVYLIPVGA
jgi:hypothetical protein